MAVRATTAGSEGTVRRSTPFIMLVVLLLLGVYLDQGALAGSSLVRTPLGPGGLTNNPLTAATDVTAASRIVPSFGSPPGLDSGNNVYYVGAQAPTQVCNPTCTYLTNSGARTTVQVVAQSVTGCLSYWIGDDSAANIWGQVGYYICSGPTPLAFYQIWNLNTGSLLTTGTANVTEGYHTFSMYSQSGSNTWAYALDGAVFGTYDMGSNLSLGTYPVQAVSEEGLVSAPWNPALVGFSTAMQTYQTPSTNPIGSGWASVSSAFEPWGGCTSSGTANNSGGYTCWGAAGNLQNSSIPLGSLVTGGTTPLTRSGANLWSGTAPDFSLSASPTSVAISVGATGTSVVYVGSLDGFSGTVSLASAVTPSGGLSCAVNPTTVTGSGTATLTCTGSAGGTYTVTVTGTSGLLSHSTGLVFDVTGSVDLTVSYSVAGGGSGYSAPTLTYVQSGNTKTVTLAITPTTFWPDPDSLWSVTNPLLGSSVGERWRAIQATNGTATSNATTVFVYYHQVWVAFTYTVKGGSGYSAPTVTYSNFSASQTVMALGLWIWADSGAPYSYQNPLPGSTSTGSWRTNRGSGTTDSTTTYTASYRLQYKVKVRTTTTTGAPLPDSPLINVTVFGSDVSLPADNVTWVDAGGSYSLPSVFYGPTPGERWLTTTPPTGFVLGPTNITAAYGHQYYLSVLVNAPPGGTISGTSGWFNATDVAVLYAVASPGWQFEGWIGNGTGSYSGASATASVVVEAPLTETAVFYVGLSLDSSNGGALRYTYLGTTGWVPAGTRVNLYLAPGTNVSVRAEPLLFYELQGWSGSAGGTSPAIALVAQAPQSVSASFGVSLYSKPDSVLGLGLLASAIVTLAASLHRYRRRKKARAIRQARIRARA